MKQPDTSKVNIRYSARAMVKPISFFCIAPNADCVCLVGDFNGWHPFSHPMEKRMDGGWFLQIRLSHGHHRYHFLVDGRPTLDPTASGVTRNPWNERVSLMAVS
jgi:1,4-alpha-glucan branching enzyme